MWHIDCFIESELRFAVNSYSYESAEPAFLAAKDVLARNKITGIYAVDIYSEGGLKKRRFYNADELKFWLLYL